MRKSLNKKERFLLDVVREQFERWRAKKKGREAIPDALWKAAAGVVGAVPITLVGRELGLDCSKLKRQVERHRTRRRPVRGRKARRAAFVEVTAPQTGGRVPPETTMGAAVEFERSDGTRLRLSGDALRGLDLATLVSRFSAEGRQE